ncbi:hypothetical protein SPRG_21268 [Saprolegnia parasitica CBS 223.65]|uniref:Uncharacterized protein n=1 Tax=Saprolegnia parasitica (strain CBS 223.65) TaxID=695850 RepID=A0A067BPW8_SAPPC|nr:hypothetical protein SPRG_21268 [Saprolegnia parasitica CBS 223.65]KDO20549.1 hypothetical protein SPRG_21268 [Saprolegnia parasitica CBS 223.65]|eukprot:XP_012208762.1 hypothetical protein SPRG_21268 [Saprolegnia parasitica CBS 223.65]
MQRRRPVVNTTRASQRPAQPNVHHQVRHQVPVLQALATADPRARPQVHRVATSDRLALQRRVTASPPAHQAAASASPQVHRVATVDRRALRAAAMASPPAHQAVATTSPPVHQVATTDRSALRAAATKSLATTKVTLGAAGTLSRARVPATTMANPVVPRAIQVAVDTMAAIDLAHLGKASRPTKEMATPRAQSRRRTVARKCRARVSRRGKVATPTEIRPPKSRCM